MLASVFLGSGAASWCSLATAFNWQSATSQQRLKVLQQLADIYLELEKHPFPRVGSIFEPDGQVGPFAQTRYFQAPEQSLGPFVNLQDTYTAIIKQQQQGISDLEFTRFPLDNYLAFSWRLEHLPELLSTSGSPSGPFYLRHGEDKGDHILIDNEYNITAIIDWEFSSVDAKEYAFSSPTMAWPIGKYFAGDNTLCPEEVEFAKMFEARGRKDMADIVMNGRRWQRFLDFQSDSIVERREDLESFFVGLRNCFSESSNKEQGWSYESWKKSVTTRYWKDSIDM